MYVYLSRILWYFSGLVSVVYSPRLQYVELKRSTVCIWNMNSDLRSKLPHKTHWVCSENVDYWLHFIAIICHVLVTVFFIVLKWMPVYFMTFFPLFRNVACVPNFGQAGFQISTATQRIDPKLLCYYRASGQVIQKRLDFIHSHYTDVIMGAIAFQITSLTIISSTVYSDADQR